MKLPLNTTFLLKIPFFHLLFNSRFDGFSEDFTTYYNHNLETNPEDNLKLFEELYSSENDIEKKMVIHNLGVYYYRYQEQYWLKRPYNGHNVFIWENKFLEFLPSYNEKYNSKILINPKWDKLTEDYTKFILVEPDVFQYIILGMEMMFLDETVPPKLLPAFALAILIVYYDFKSEVEIFLEMEDPTYKII